MPSANIVIESPVEQSFRVQQVAGMFDVPPSPTIRHEWSVNLPIENEEWQIGLIVGPSGSGKTTIAKHLFSDSLVHQQYDWPETSSILDGFPEKLPAKDITSALSSVGFSSPPHWLKRFSHLSNGQKFRCELARLILEDADIVVFDEFTSVVDRDVAKVCSAAVAKAIRRRKSPKFVALSCHYDIAEWLLPDWIYNTENGEFTRVLLRQRPNIELSIRKTDSAAWLLFRGHHYLSRELHQAAACFVACWNGNPVAFTSYLHMPHPKAKNLKREHRTVVLPDFQGVGIGNALSAWVGSYCKKNGFRFRSTTSHPAMIRHRMKSKDWKVENVSHQLPFKAATSGAKTWKSFSTGRLTASCEYIGPELKTLHT